MLANIYAGDFELLGRKRAKIKVNAGRMFGVSKMLEVLDAALSDAGVRPDQLAGIGVAVPGPVNPEKGTAVEMTNLGWHDLSLRDEFGKRLSCPVYVLNDVDAGTYGEYSFGAARGARCVVGVFTGTGLGGGCVYKGHLLQGAQRTCFEIGHLRVVSNGIRCGCGGRGCLETVASRLAISQAVAAAAFRGEAPTVQREAGTDLRKIRSKLIAASVAAGEVAVERIIRDAARWLGVGVASAINLVNPDTIVLGGGLVEAMPDLILENVRASADEHSMRSFQGTYRVAVAQLGDDATAKGAAAWARYREDTRQ
jgi:glucokinase